MTQKSRLLAVRALDQWEQILYYHQLIENRFDQQDLENLLLHQECYLKLVREHHIQLDKTLRALRKQLIDDGGA